MWETLDERYTRMAKDAVAQGAINGATHGSVTPPWLVKEVTEYERDVEALAGTGANPAYASVRLSNEPMTLPADSKARKDVPIGTGVLDYFPRALAEVAKLSKIGNDKHNPGQHLRWAKEKSADHPDCIVRHFIDRGKIDPDSGLLHDVGLAWRALANLEVTLEALAASSVQP